METILIIFLGLLQIAGTIFLFIKWYQEHKENERLRHQLELVTEFASHMFDEAGGEEF